MSTAVFDKTFGQSVAPVLLGLGFRAVRPPEGWMAPAKLFEYENRWFGASWDPRDQYLAVALGRLFRFRDVMPSVVVRGPYHYSADCAREDVQDFLTRHLARVGQELPKALEQFDGRLAAALEADRMPPEGAGRKARRVFAEYVGRLGDPIVLEDWKGSQVVQGDHT